MSDLHIRDAAAADLAPMQRLIQRAYRGESARAGWTHEADMIEGERISLTELTALFADPAERLLTAWSGETLVGGVRVARLGGDLAYLGLLWVDPDRQGAGVGHRLITAAEALARDAFAARRIEMTVIDSRTELIDYYRRRGYAPVGSRPFPIALDPPLAMVVLEKPLR